MRGALTSTVLVQGDVSKEDKVAAMVGNAISELDGVDVLVNNAGIQVSRPSHELSSDDFDKVLERRPTCVRLTPANPGV